MKAIRNPAYATAKYEYLPIWPRGKKPHGPYWPVRGNRIENGKIVDTVPPFILAPETPAK